jgi:lysozyme
MNPTLRTRLSQAVAGGAIAIAGVLANWHESGGKVYHKPYLDPVGILTVCDGITGPDVIASKTYTDSECDALRSKHLAIAQAAVRRVIHVPLTVWQEAALIDFAYNVGETKLTSSTMAAMFNARNYAGGCAQLNRWVKGMVKGQLVALGGLVARRQDETDICVGMLANSEQPAQTLPAPAAH